MSDNKKRGGVRKSQGSAAFEIVSREEANIFGAWPAKVTSPLLDPVLHPEGVLTIIVGAPPDDEGGGGSALDQFQTDSLTEYLARQADVRQALTSALDEHLATWDRKKTLGRGEGVWEHVKVSVVSLRTRPTEPPVPSTSFLVELDAEWPDEHKRWVEFENGELAEFQVE